TVSAVSDVCTQPHAFATPGYHNAIVTMQISDGYSTRTTASVDVVPVSPFTADVSLLSEGLLSVSVSMGASSDDWNITTCTVDFGDGQRATDCGPTHT